MGSLRSVLVLLAVAAATPAVAPVTAPVTAPVATPSAGPVDEVPVGVWPLDPVPDVVAHFDPPDSPYGAGHRGVDLAGWVGQPVRAALPGRVSYAGTLAGRGVVVVDHGATRTTYLPVAATAEVGDRVLAGDRIGLLEAAGSHCAPAVCLHWGWIRGETYLDPLLLVGAGPVRLLPLAGEGPTVPGVGAGAGVMLGAGAAAESGAGVAGVAAWWRPPSPQARGWAWR